MIIPTDTAAVLTYAQQKGKQVFFFKADWCGDCRFIEPALPEIEAENLEFVFIQVDRDEYPEIAKTWNIYGIPSLLVFENGLEIGRFVNRDRKTKKEINEFLAEFK